MSTSHDVKMLADHVRAHLDPEDLSVPPSDPRVLLRIRCARLPSFDIPSAVRFDVREDGVTVRRRQMAETSIVEMPLAEWQRFALLPDVEESILRVGTAPEGLDGFLALVECSDARGYRAASYWMRSAEAERRLCLAVTRAFELASRP